MEDDTVDFEYYCIDVLNILNYDFLSKEEWEYCWEQYEKYLEKKFRRETGRCYQCGNYMDECGCDR
jgi:hypothetical protein